MNYRCGVFGFLAHPWLSAESDKGISVNYGSFDQIAALEWVSENISAFGGDPERITVFGQSAGCMSTQILVSSELTKDKIRGAILQSGVQTRKKFLATPTLEMAENFGKRVVEIAGAGNIQELRAMDTKHLLEAKAHYDAEVMYRMMAEGSNDGAGGLTIVPNVDGYLLKENVRDAFEKGDMKKIPYMAGCVMDDLGTTNEDRAQDRPGVLLTSCWEWCIRQEELGNPKAYCYLFSHKLPGDGKKDTAIHTAEVWYNFGTLGRCWRPMQEEDYALSREMVDAWTNFIKRGNPNGENVAEWKPCTAGEEFVRNFT